MNNSEIYVSRFSYLPQCHGPVTGWKRISRHEVNERRIKFIRVGDTVRTVGQLKGELTLNRGP